MHAQRDVPPRQPVLAEALEQLAPFPLDARRVAPALRQLVDCGCAELPPPGSGHTLRRWRALADVAATDLALLKLYEGHTDAVAILDELGETAAEGTWGVWAAEVPGTELRFEPDWGRDGGHLFGRKSWCSGASGLDYALLTAAASDGASVLVRVALDQPEIQCHGERWHAIGMAATGTADVTFDGALGECVGKPGAYLRRAGFWHGALGIAACWYGAARAVAMTLRQCERLQRDPHAQAHLGAVDAQLFAARCALQAAANAIDAAPADDARVLALRVRAIVEVAATATLERVGRALGAAPLCADAVHAQRCADLTTFLRQSHGEADLQTLGSSCVLDDGRLGAAVHP